MSLINPRGRGAYWCSDCHEWHEPPKCYVCLTEFMRLGYGEVREPTRIVSVWVNELGRERGVIFRARVCDVHPTNDEIYGVWGLQAGTAVTLEVER